MKLINILIISFLLTLAPCYAEFGSEVIVDGTGIQTDDDAELNSLDVLLYVKSSTLEPHQANTPVVIKPESGSTTDDVLEIQSEDGTAITTFDNSGGLQVDNFAVGCAPSGVSGEAKIGTILPCDDSSPNVIALPSGSSATEIAEFKKEDGTVMASVTNSGNFAGEYFSAEIYASSPAFKPRQTTQDLILQLKSDTKKFALQNSAGSDTFTFSLSGDDRVMSFFGGSNTGTITWDDSAPAFEFSENLLCRKFLNALSAINCESYITSKNGYYGDALSDPAAFPKGLETAGNITVDTADTYYIGFDGTTIKRFLKGYFGTIDTIVLEAQRVLSRSDDDFRIAARDGYGVVLMEQFDGVDRMRVSTEVADPVGAPNDIDINLEVFDGGGQTGTLQWNDGNNYWYFKNPVRALRVYADELQNQAQTGPPSATYWLTDGTADDATVTASATLTTAQHFVKIDSNDGSSTPITLTLPTAVGNTGKIYTFKVIDYQGTITIKGNGTETIDGSNTYTGLSAQYDSIRVVSDGTEWWIF